MSAPWITVVGIGDAGLPSLGADARRVVEAAEVLVGGARHHAMVPETSAERITWERGVRDVVGDLTKHQGRRVVVLATGDPTDFGVGAIIGRRLGPDTFTVMPHAGAFSLAAARMRWSQPDVVRATVHGRPLASLNRHLEPGARILLLCRDGDSPAEVARLLAARGYGDSRITALEHLGGPEENVYDGTAAGWAHPRGADLVTLAIDCVGGPDAFFAPACAGLPDDLYEHDGQITKREVRAVTVASLRPRSGAVLWDVGAGAGSVGIEWLRLAPPHRVARTENGTTHVEAACLSFESDPARAERIARNAAALGVPDLRVVEGRAPEAFADVEGDPDAVFVGGGVAAPGLLEACWDRLRPGGLLVANAVTLAAQARLMAARETWGGALSRIAVAREAPLGQAARLKPLAPVLHYVVEKP